MAVAISQDILWQLPYNFNMEGFDKKLKELREEKGLTQEQLAKATGISQAGIAKLETGDRSPSVDTIIFLAKFFDCTADYLIGLENSDKK